MTDETWVFLVCGAVLLAETVAGWHHPRYPDWLLELRRRRGESASLSDLMGVGRFVVGAAWVYICLSMTREFSRYVLGPGPAGVSSRDVGLVWLWLLSAVAFMVVFLGTAARWAWNKGYEAAEREYGEYAP